MVSPHTGHTSRCPLIILMAGGHEAGDKFGFCLKLKIELQYDPAIPPLGIYPERTKILIRKDTCTPMLTEALFIIAKT